MVRGLKGANIYRSLHEKKSLSLQTIYYHFHVVMLLLHYGRMLVNLKVNQILKFVSKLPKILQLRAGQ